MMMQLTKNILLLIFMIIVTVPNTYAETETIDYTTIDYLDNSRCPFWYFSYRYADGKSGISVYNTLDGYKSIMASWNEYSPAYSPITGINTVNWNTSALWVDFPHNNFCLIASCVIKCNDFVSINGREYDKEYILELYSTSLGKDYLVIARDDTTIVCMQYINTDNSYEFFSTEFCDINDMNINVYSHYYRTRASDTFHEYTTYFLDGTAVNIIFSMDNDSYIQKEHFTSNEMLIKYFDICTFDESFIRKRHYYKSY